MTLLEYVKRMPGHKNSKGEPAPWVIVSHKTGKVLSSHKTKEDAEEHLRHMHIFKEGVEMTDFEKYIEYVESETGLEFYGDLGAIDDIGAYREEFGREADYVIARCDTDEHEIWVKLGHSFGDEDDEDFFWMVELDDEPPKFKNRIENWLHAAEEVTDIVLDLNSGVKCSDIKESRSIWRRTLNETAFNRFGQRKKFDALDVRDRIVEYIIGNSDTWSNGWELRVDKQDRTGTSYITARKKGYVVKLFSVQIDINDWDGELPPFFYEVYADVRGGYKIQAGYVDALLSNWFIGWSGTGKVDPERSGIPNNDDLLEKTAEWGKAILSEYDVPVGKFRR